MTKCRPEDSAHFLSGTLSDAEEASFIEHLDACETCQQRLRQAAGSEEDWQSTKNYLLCCCEAHEPGVSAASERGDREVREESIVRGLLAPSDFPESIGRVGPYEIVGLLGRGGAGIVLKGFDRSLNRCVAVKVLDPVWLVLERHASGLPARRGPWRRSLMSMWSPYLAWMSIVGFRISRWNMSPAVRSKVASNATDNATWSPSFEWDCKLRRP